jgi:tetratricopeptide (TPR) repeat protein
MNASWEHEAARRARSLETHGFRRAAIDVLEAALANEPEAGTLWRLRAVLLTRDGRHDEAFVDVQQALALAPLEAEELLILADGYVGAGLDASAADVYLSLAARSDLPYELWPKLFAGLCRVKRWQSALAVCRRAAQERPDDDLAFYAMAQALARLGRPAEMIIGVLCKAIDLNPADPRSRVLLAIQLLRVGKHTEAYGCLAELPPQSFVDVSCACCAWKLLRLCVSSGDAPRAAAFAAQLAHLSIASSARRGAEEGTS